METYVVAGHTHALEKAEQLTRVTGVHHTVRSASLSEYFEQGAARCHYLVIPTRLGAAVDEPAERIYDHRYPDNT